MSEFELTYKGLPVVVADDDFLEYLQEEGYDDSIDLQDVFVEWHHWALENVKWYRLKSLLGLF